MTRYFGKMLFAAVLLVLGMSSARAEMYTAYLSGAQQVPVAATSATGYARVNINEAAGTMTFTIGFNNLSSTQTAAYVHAPGAIGANAAVIITIGNVGGTSGTISGTRTITPTQIAQLRGNQGYVNVFSNNFSVTGEIRGQLARARSIDYDGDGRQDYSVLRFPANSPPTPSPIVYYNMSSTSGFSSAYWGDANTDFPAPGDYDGDGRTDIALYRTAGTGGQNTFWIIRSSDGAVQVVYWGIPGDQVCARDFDGDGKTDPTVFRRGATPTAQAHFYIQESSTGNLRQVVFGTTGVAGTSGDLPVPADYDGDGKADIAVYRYGGISPNNTFIVQRSSGGAIFQQLGNPATDYIVPGDYDGDGKADFMAAKMGTTSTSPMRWYMIGTTEFSRNVQFGLTSDIPAQGDYDGDGRIDIAVYRPGATAGAQSAFWSLNSLSNNGFSNNASVFSWGISGDFPVSNSDVR